MAPIDNARDRLRRLLDEQIPEGGTDKDTRFTNDDLDGLLGEAGSLYSAASLGWTEKAGMFQREMAGIEQMTTGQESYRMTSLKDQLDYALKMAKTYADMAAMAQGGSWMMKVKKPEVL